jgi:hypothetical protein
MAPSTRNTARASTPDRPIKAKEFDTIKRSAFFRDYDQFHGSKTLGTISADNNISDRTARRWLAERRDIGSPAYRHMRQRSKVLGRKSRVSKETCQMLVSPSRNPVRDQLYEAQIQYHHIPIQPRQLIRRLKSCTKNAQRFKQAYVGKVLSKKNRTTRVTYGEEHQDKSIHDYWQYLFFTDEAHIDPSSCGASWILREEGTREDTENIQERPEKEGVKLHIAAWVNWNMKCEKLLFYHDEEEHTEQPLRPPKPRRRPRTETQEQWEARLLEWEALLPHPVDVKPKGNSMTQKYYTEHLLPVYISAIQNARLTKAGPWILQEDNDGSHGTRGKKKNMAKLLKEANWIDTLVHPAQSPDLNPIEACWNILKQRVRQRVWRSLAELKEILQEEWDKITIQEIRARISEMPERCKKLVKSGGGPIKSKLW